ncbi:IS110 family transposase [Snodgrassella sp. CFCC 13594]|uniref:IS110 family transposase n=1 Tax=Snodgrassella sp. CFCC 13594 TaxID=1775559 RepID=UPI000834B7B1|nr:IS110 family transposase [Snodgrassella sp. CFCC 13594]
MHYLGIDISKCTFDCHLITDKGEFFSKFDNNKQGFLLVATWITKTLLMNDVGQIHVCMEATGAYWQSLATFLHEKGFVVSVENPSKIKHFSKAIMVRNKTDKQDAKTIAQYCQIMMPRRWYPESHSIIELRNIMRLLVRLKRQKASEQTKLIETPKSLSYVIECNIAHFQQQIAEVELLLNDFFNQYPEFKKQRKRLETVPGIGKTSAAVLLSVLLGSQQFTKASQLVAYLGLNPQAHQSGTSVNGKMRISKVGKSDLRTALYMPAMVAYSHNLYPELIARLKLKNKPTMVIITAIMRKLAVYAFTIYKNQTDFKRA